MSLREVLPLPSDPLPREVARKLANNRVAAAAVSIQRAWQEQPSHAERIIGRELRRARWLHSRQRRLLGDLLYEILRHHRAFDDALDLVPEADPAWGRFLATMVLRGLHPEEAAAVYTREERRAAPPFEDIADLQGEASAALPELDPLEALELVGSLSPGLARELHRSLADPAAFLLASNRRAPLVLRANAERIGREELADQLEQQGLPTRPTALARHGLIAERRTNLRALHAYQQGLVEVQEEGSQLLAELAAAALPTGGLAVDYCAGAGGKSLALAAMCPHATIAARDVRSRALDELRRRARRARAADRIEARRLAPGGSAQAGPAPVVLVDAPCSGTGTLRRHPGLRLRVDAASLEEQAEQQLRILHRAARAVASGGLLIYATCSVLRCENQEVVQAFSSRRRRFRRVPVTELLGERAAPWCEGPDLQLLPHMHDTDGFYAAALRRS